MSSQQGTLLDVLKKKMRQTKEEAEKYQEEAEEYRKKLQIEIRRREEVSSVPFLFCFWIIFFFWIFFFFSIESVVVCIIFFFYQMPFTTFGFLEVVFFFEFLYVCVYV